MRIRCFSAQHLEAITTSAIRVRIRAVGYGHFIIFHVETSAYIEVSGEYSPGSVLSDEKQKAVLGAFHCRPTFEAD